MRECQIPVIWESVALSASKPVDICLSVAASKDLAQLIPLGMSIVVLQMYVPVSGVYHMTRGT